MGGSLGPTGARLHTESACGILSRLELRRWLNWIEHLTTDQEVTGSSPVRRAIRINDLRPVKRRPFSFLYPWALIGLLMTP